MDWEVWCVFLEYISRVSGLFLSTLMLISYIAWTNASVLATTDPDILVCTSTPLLLSPTNHHPRSNNDLLNPPNPNLPNRSNRNDPQLPSNPRILHSPPLAFLHQSINGRVYVL